MKKFTFTIELVHGSDIDVHSIVQGLSDTVDNITEYHSVDYDGSTNLSEQGLKVWAKRKVGVSLATPKPAKAPRVKKSEENTEVVA
jgi:hypothetical protein